VAVYTHLGAEQLASLLNEYDVGDLVSAKGIAEGVSNSNWLIETTQDRFILTMYERRTDISDLPFFLGLLDHLAATGCPVPKTIHDRNGALSREIDGKAVALIEFLPGVSPSAPSAAQAKAVGEALARLHLATASYPEKRINDMGAAHWPAIAAACGDSALATIDPSLPQTIRDHLESLLSEWPRALPAGVVHADLFPDNVLFVGNEVSGMIDFYFACSDAFAYDLAVTHAAWCFDRKGQAFDAELSHALVQGYQKIRSLTPEERTALPVLAKGASMRFILSRADDWLNTPEDALVERKDPMDFVRRLEFYDRMGDRAFS